MFFILPCHSQTHRYNGNELRYTVCHIESWRLTDGQLYVNVIPDNSYMSGSDYWRNVLYDIKTGKRMTFRTESEAVAYLGKFGWENVREYRDGMKHVILMQKSYDEPYLYEWSKYDSLSKMLDKYEKTESKTVR